MHRLPSKRQNAAGAALSLVWRGLGSLNHSHTIIAISTNPNKLDLCDNMKYPKAAMVDIGTANVLRAGGSDKWNPASY